jgi:hypothetical protein
MRSLVLLAVGSLIATGTVSAQDFRWHAPLASGKTLEVRGISGRVRAVRASGGEAEVTAVKKAGRRGDPDDVEIKVLEDGDGVTICALYPTRRGGMSECRPGGGGGDNMKDTDVSVDFEVKVPAGVDFVGTTVNGDVYASDLPADARVSSVNGDVEVSAAGTARGTTVNGSVVATVGKAGWSGTLEFSTVNGGIRLTLPADLDADVDASTVNGSIDSDFPITVQGRMRPREFHGRIGKGGRKLELSTVNGSIELRKGS